MSPQFVFCGMFALLFLYFTWVCIKSEEDGKVLVFCFATTVVFGYLSYQGTTAEHLAEQKVEDARRAEARRREETPHVIRESDGCKVYAFKAGDSLHYFTRCPNSTTKTDRTYKVCRQSGKTTHCENRVESIEVVQGLDTR